MRYPKDPQALQRWINAFVILHFVAVAVLDVLRRMSDDPGRYLLAQTVVVALLGIGFLARLWTDLKFGWAMDIYGWWRSRVEEPFDYRMATAMDAFFVLACLGVVIHRLSESTS